MTGIVAKPLRPSLQLLEQLGEDGDGQTVVVAYADILEHYGYEADRCSGGNSCSITCDNGTTYTLTGFSNLCTCQTSGGVLRLSCGPGECPDVEIKCGGQQV